METKVCTKCGTEKLLDDFYKQKGYQSSINPICKRCKTIINKKWQKANLKKVKAYQKTYREANKWKNENYSKAYRKANIEKTKGYNKAYRSKNHKKLIAYLKFYHKANPKKIAKYHKAYYEKKRNDHKYKLNRNISNNMRYSLRGNKNGSRWERLVDFTIEQLKKHLEKLFTEGMSWDNYGKNGWEIDHKIPVDAFNFTKPEHTDFQKCWALENLQPMWKKENILKSNKLTKHFQPSLLL